MRVLSKLHSQKAQRRVINVRCAKTMPSRSHESRYYRKVCQNHAPQQTPSRVIIVMCVIITPPTATNAKVIYACVRAC